ncbi:MAG: TraM recognition domain-containing protein [Proteobacteria bacterium]|nr:TraM recognition domain-containing protein [Pseudomonadota bacterium]
MSLKFKLSAPMFKVKGTVIQTLDDWFRHIIVFGATGSGKTSGPGWLIRNALLADTQDVPGGCGGLVLMAKASDCAEWIAACREAGRTDDIVRIAPGTKYGFNILDWISSWGTDGDRGPIATVALLEEIASAVDQGGSDSGGENAFFAGAHRNKLTNLVMLCQLARLSVSLSAMRELSSSAPETLQQVESDTWRRRSACWQALAEASHLTKGDPAARADFRECRRFHLRDYPSLSSRTRGVVEIMFSSLTQPFLTRPLRPLFCEATTVTPEACFAGKILLIDLPVQEYGLVGKLAALAWKRAFQLAVMRRTGPLGSLRPVFWFADEAQNFLSASDAEYQAVARSSGGVTCLLTQQISSIRDALGSEDKAEALLANLMSKWFCQNTGETNSWASELIGERYVNIANVNMGRGGSESVDGPASSHAGISTTEQKRFYLEPAAFQRLRRGGVENDLLVDAVLFAGGKQFPSDQGPAPYRTVTFRQR